MSLPEPAIPLPLAVPPREAARLLSISLRRIYSLLSAGALESYCDGRTRRIPVKAIEAYIARRLAAGGSAAVDATRLKQQQSRAEVG